LTQHLTYDELLLDPVVEEIRLIREEQAARFNYNVRAIIEDSQKREQTSGHEVVSFCEPCLNLENQA
jgi:hypothetical protein